MNPPRSDRIRSSMTFLRDVPGETSFMKSRNVFSFSCMVSLIGGSIYNFMCFDNLIGEIWGGGNFGSFALVFGRWLLPPWGAKGF